MSVEGGESRPRRAWLAPVVVVAVAIVTWHLAPSPSAEVDYAQDLARRSSADHAAAMQLGRMYVLALLNATKGAELPIADSENARMAEEQFDQAARLLPESCQPVLAKGILKFALGDDLDAAALFQRALSAADCDAPARLYLGYLDEFAGDLNSAREQFLATAHENFHERVYGHTDPDLGPDQYARRLRKLIAFRDAFEEFYAGRNRSEAREFLGPVAFPGPGAGVDTRGSTTHLHVARQTLTANDFVILRSFLSPWEVRQVQGFYADLIADGTIANFDPDLSRTVTYNDRLSHWIGQRMTDALNAIASEPVKHVYSFLCWHRTGPGAQGRPVLKPHTDREDNDWTVSIQMHYDDTTGEKSWPIWVHIPRQEEAKAGWKAQPPRAESVKVMLHDGDAVLFRGRRHVHWRDPMPDSGLSFSSLLLHYVPKEFDWRDFKFVRQMEDPAI